MRQIFCMVAMAALLWSSSTAVAGPNCTCRYAGQNFKTGAIMCIRGKLSRCDFVLNNTSWKVLADTCPQVKAPLQSYTAKIAEFGKQSALN